MLKATQDLAGGTTPLVHLRDVCRAQVFLAEKGEAAAAAGGRYLCCGANTTVARLAGFLAGKFPQYNVKTDGYVPLLSPSQNIKKKVKRNTLLDSFLVQLYSIKIYRPIILYILEILGAAKI